jgi:5-histidylcysteine sulfoxide synthase/putative 4-mercaptohistidine N1-methyltranferase
MNPLKSRLPRTPVLTGENVTKTRQEILDYFLSTNDCYEHLFETLKDNHGATAKSITLRHPLIFYFGHTATFFVNKFLVSGLIKARVNPALESMFAVGVDEMSWDDLNDENYDWPTLDQVKVYRNQVRDMVVNVISNQPLSLPIDWHHPWWVIVMCIEHERIHLETSSVLIRQQALDLVNPHSDWKPFEGTGEAPENTLIPIPAGSVELSKSKNPDFYGWDNEFGTHEAELVAFKASQYLVSNAEFNEFVQDGGYQHDAYWKEEGLQWRRFTNQTYPTFWVSKNNKWFLRLMTEEVPMPWDWPVEVNYHEAKAFCGWKSTKTNRDIRLPTEDEWYRIYDDAQSKVSFDLNQQANIHLDFAASSCPVNHFKQGGLYDVTGNVWQWTETPIYPFNGFEVHPVYDDFSTPTFDGQHNLMKGGSWISCGNEAIYSARYAFRRHFFQHAGFRYVESGNQVDLPQSHYESDKLISEYAEFHYGDAYFGVPNFPKSLVALAMQQLANKPLKKAMDIGCASGRATFELAQYFEEVIGLDFSARLIEAGTQLLNHGEIKYTMMNEGDLVTYQSRTLTELNLTNHREVSFIQGDACNLKSILIQFDFIMAANLIDRLYNPKKFLNEVHSRLNIGGVLLIASPYTWLEEHTPREEWIGGIKKDAENFTTLDGLKEILGVHFKMISQPTDVPFVIRETDRKYQHSISEVTLWERVS